MTNKVDIRRLDSTTINDTAATALINENFEALQTAIENTLSRDGTTPNYMDADLDLNSYKIINAGDPENDHDVITKGWFDQFVEDASTAAADANAAATRAASSAQTASISAQNAEASASAALDDAELAKDWATKTDGTVDGVDYSSKYYAQQIIPIATDISTVAGIASDVTTVSGIASDVTDVADIKNDVTTVSGIASDVTAVKNNATDISAVASNETNINTVAGDSTSINSVAGDLTNIDTVATDIANVNATSSNIANVNAVANNETNINAVNANKTNIDTVATNITDINAVAADLANIDAAPTYAAEAKQWAIGVPSEPSEGSAKYWAGQAAAGQINSDWTETDTSSKSYILNKPNLATVATSGSYNDLLNKPSIPAAQVNSDWNAVSGVAQILNKPTIPTVNNATLTITQGGVSKGTFTANASSDVTIALDSGGTADVDLSNITDSGTSTGASWGMPSGVYDSLTVGASETTYIAPANGYVLFLGRATSNATLGIMYDYTSVFGQTISFNTSTPMAKIFMPMRKGWRFRISYSSNVSDMMLRFVYAVGSEWEKE